MKEKLDCDVNAARKIWSFGPETEGADEKDGAPQDVQNLIELKEHVVKDINDASVPPVMEKLIAVQTQTTQNPLCKTSFLPSLKKSFFAPKYLPY